MLRSRLFANNQRLNAASNNNPIMRRGETDVAAVRLLQQGLRDLQVATMRRSITAGGMFDGDFSTETERALRRFQRENTIGEMIATGSGHADRETLQAMDSMLEPMGVEPLTPTTAAAAPPPVETPTTLRGGVPKRPDPERLRREYEAFTAVGGKPCRRGAVNQCAIRLCVALGRCDIGFHLSYGNTSELRIHGRNSRLCGGNLEPHESGAARLFRYLAQFWQFTKYEIDDRHPGSDIYARVCNEPAIIFFHRLRTGGDHIDFFDGRRIMNDELNYAAPGEPSRGRADKYFRWTNRAIHVLPLWD